MMEAPFGCQGALPCFARRTSQMFVLAAAFVKPRTDPIKTKESRGSLLRLRTMAAYLRADWLRCLILALLGIFVRSPALQGQRIWDDQYLAHDHPLIKSPFLILE